MKKTVLTLVIESIEGALSGEVGENQPEEKKEIMRSLAAYLKSVLPIEREQIQQAYIDGITHRSELKCKLPENYFTKYFEQYTP